MEGLIREISQRAGISEDQARTAVTMVIGYLDDRLPPPLAAQLRAVLAGSGGNDPGGQAQQLLGGLFGKK